MQITSTLTQNTMEPLNGNVSNVAAPADADQISGAFCHQFYVTVSENRHLLEKFYGHESTFQFNGDDVTGPAEIAKLYSSLPESSHFKIHNIKGLPTLHNSGIIVQVLGALNHRPFVQTFILGQQGLKKYYIEVDQFQFLDTYFDIKFDQSRAATSSASSVSANGHVSSNGLNGQVPKPTKAQEKQTELIQNKQAPQKSQQTPKKSEENSRQTKQETSKIQEKEVIKPPKAAIVHQQQSVPPHHQQQSVPPHLQQQAPAPPSGLPEPVQQEQPKAPRTWATLVGGGKQPPPQLSQQHLQQLQVIQQQQAAVIQHHQQSQAMFQHQQHQQQIQHQQILQRLAPQAPQNRNDSHPPQGGADRDPSLNERKIYLGGITREIVPSNTQQAENEIKQVFFKFGEVEEVRMPRKVLDSPNDTSKQAFAFITMRNKQGVQAIFADATRDGQGIWKLPLKLDAFGFDGLAQVSEQRDPPNGGFRGGRGGGGFGQRGGGYFRRGGPGGPRGGGMRGGFNNGLNGQQ